MGLAQLSVIEHADNWTGIGDEMSDTMMKILYGPPGTGKTYRAAREAVRIIKPDAEEGDLRDLHKALVESGRIIWVTFHPSYSYEDFVEGLRPVVVAGTGITYEPRPGPFKKACENCTNGEVFSVGDILTSSTHQEYEIVHVGSHALILKNLKGKGAGLVTPVSLKLVDKLKSAGYEPGDLSLPGQEHDRKAEISAEVGWDMQTLFGMTGPLRAVWEKVESDTEAVRRTTVLVIDEINRADLARVFGELITLIDIDKRLGAPEERRIVLPYSGELFGVPPELSIIGTMNTADRSIALVDLALRRRFGFQSVNPDPSLCAFPYAGVDLRTILEHWNTRVKALLSREHRIGHSYLMEGVLERIRENGGYTKDEDGELKAIATTIRMDVLPLLQEYFHDDWRRIDLVFGRDFGRLEGGLLEEERFDELDARADEVADLSEVSDYLIPDYWNPESDSWNADRFRTALSR